MGNQGKSNQLKRRVIHSHIYIYMLLLNVFGLTVCLMDRLLQAGMQHLPGIIDTTS